MKYEYDIKTAGNTIGGKQGWAYVCNSHEIPVLVANLDNHSEYDTKNYRTFGIVNVYVDNKMGNDFTVDGTLALSEGKWKITSGGCFISASFNYHDSRRLIDGAIAPVIHKDEVVAIAMCSDKHELSCLLLYKARRINPHCMVVCDLEPLTEDEMKDVVEYAKKWLSK